MKVLNNTNKFQFIVIAVIGVFAINMVLNSIISIVLYRILDLEGDHPIANILSVAASIAGLAMAIFIGWKLSQKKAQDGLVYDRYQDEIPEILNCPVCGREHRNLEANYCAGCGTSLN